METLNLLAAAGVLEGLKETGLSIQEQFGVQGQLLASQAIGFLIFAAALYKWAFKPLQEMLEQRRARIIVGEENVKRIEQQLADSEAATTAAIAKANENAARLVEEAKESAAVFSAQKSQEAIASAQQILAKAEAAAAAERAAIRNELRNEFGRLVAATTSQVTGKVLTDDDQRRINEDALAKVEG
ncbi:MAG: ATP synthase F0 subunit B [Verrucomicrobiota bacterium]